MLVRQLLEAVHVLLKCGVVDENVELAELVHGLLDRVPRPLLDCCHLCFLTEGDGTFGLRWLGHGTLGGKFGLMKPTTFRAWVEFLERLVGLTSSKLGIDG